jgi:hypothetical protein
LSRKRLTPTRDGRTPKDGGVRREFFELTEAQLEAMLEAASKDEPRVGHSVGAEREIDCEITRSRSGGRHLYVTIRDGSGRKLHIARNGKPTEVEAAT